jgi:hypothetical protein
MDDLIGINLAELPVDIVEQITLYAKIQDIDPDKRFTYSIAMLTACIAIVLAEK